MPEADQMQQVPTAGSLAGAQLAGHLARRAADTIGDAFVRYHAEFKAITNRAQERFEQRDWHALHRDAEERLDLYGLYVREAVESIEAQLGESTSDFDLLASIKGAYTRLICEREDFDIAQSFYNSVLIRVAVAAGITGLDPAIEFMGTEFPVPPQSAEEPVFVTFHNRGSTQALIAELLGACRFRCKWRDAVADAVATGARIEAELAETGWGGHPSFAGSGPSSGQVRLGTVEVARPIFYRGKRAYLVGRVRVVQEGTFARFVPLVIAFSNGEDGVEVDAVLMDENEVSILFSFAREYFHVEVQCPRALVQFLRTIMPLKPVAELYISIGYNKHGKTERYRDLVRHLANSTDRFEMARGDRGMVMQVFTLPSYDLVFKIIKDTFDEPKRTTKQEVRDRYALVFRHDRGGRLVDAQEFQHLRFDKVRFQPDLLEELLKTAGRIVRVEGDSVVIDHLYTERRLVPLNLYLREVTEQAAAAMVAEYGTAIKDLASTNIFPGDILLKNFGVTRHGRIVFYDYDELCLLTDCNFREMPRGGSGDYEFDAFDEFTAYAPEPWFPVAENDVFPEELDTFLGLPPNLKAIFVLWHGELFTTAYWSDLKTRLSAGEMIEVLPYKESRRLG
jgi:isocitrate dehydrogenase kinase/phosphatase